MRVRLDLAYDGAPYAGWQSQRGGDTIQDVVESALAEIAGTAIRIHGAGRTDAGVHAEGQVCHFEAGGLGLAPADWLNALNARLPGTIRILAAESVGPDFHARFSATAKEYRYSLACGPVLPPFLYRRAWHVGGMEIAPLRAAASLFVGERNFAAFSANRGQPVVDTHRTIFSARVEPAPHGFDLTFCGSGFLYKMVRMMVGACVRHARGRVDLDDLAARLKTGTPRWNHVAPADGLCLVRVEHAQMAPTQTPRGSPSSP